MYTNSGSATPFCEPATLDCAPHTHGCTMVQTPVNARTTARMKNMQTSVDRIIDPIQPTRDFSNLKLSQISDLNHLKPLWSRKVDLFTTDEQACIVDCDDVT